MDSLQIIKEHPNFLVVFKPPGLAVHATVDKKREKLLDIVKSLNTNEEIKLLHRLDVATSGLVLLSRNSEAHEILRILWEEQKVEKIYHAKVWGSPKKDTGQWQDFVKEGREKGRDKMMVVKSGGKKAMSEYKVLKKDSTQTLLEIKLITGRKHQIRLQCASRGFPIVGDKLYGKEDNEKEMKLSCVQLSFDYEGDHLSIKV